jgi:hypothetical protein
VSLSSPASARLRFGASLLVGRIFDDADEFGGRALEW